jgi:DnaK suppressor protein
MNPAQLEEFRTILTELHRSAVSGSLAAIARGVEPDALQGEPHDMEDEAVRTGERDDVNMQAERAAGLAKRLDAALERVDGGTFGICVDCGLEIELERLRAVPWAERCADDAAAFEEQNRIERPSL